MPARTILAAYEIIGSFQEKRIMHFWRQTVSRPKRTHTCKICSRVIERTQKHLSYGISDGDIPESTHVVRAHLGECAEELESKVAGLWEKAQSNPSSGKTLWKYFVRTFYG